MKQIIGFDSRKAFTLIELLIFSAIFTFAAIAFITVLVSITRIQVRQNSSVEVMGQSQFLLQAIQHYVEQSSLVDMPAGVATTTLKLRVIPTATTTDPTYIYLSGSAVYLKQGDGGAAQPLTSSKVNVSNLSFIKKSNPGGHDSVSISFTVSYNTSNIQQQFTNQLSTSIARVSAATFDSDIRASSATALVIGASAAEWQSINGTIYFSGANVGINQQSPGQTLEINGGLRLNTTNGKPTCDTAQRGTFWVTESGSGVKDNVDVCAKNASDTYAWRTIY